MKKSLCTIILTLLVLTTAPYAASASKDEKYEKLLLLGDSITYGYGLDGDRDSCRSYGNQLREHLEIKTENFKNAAVNGDASAELLSLLPTIQKEVREADLIVVTIGGNDMLDIIWGIAGAVEWNEEKLIAALNDPEGTSKLLEMITMDVVSNAIIKYSVNLSAVVGYIRSNNQNARVLFLAQYDPASGLELGALGQITASAIKLLNTQMRESVVAGGCEYVDVYTPFVGKGAEWTNMLSADIHPNQLGHDKIFEIITEYLDKTEDDMENTPTESEASTNETQTSVKPQDSEEKEEWRGCRASLGYKGGALSATALGVALLLRQKRKDGDSYGDQKNH